MIASGKELADRLKASMKVEVAVYEAMYGRAPHLTVILVGDDPGSHSYVKGKAKAAEVVGISSTTILRPATISQDELLTIIDKLNADDTVDGILVQLPLPKHIQEDKIINAIAVEKDVDGFHTLNTGALWSKRDCIKPCTPLGIMRILEDNKIDLDGKHAVVVGRSQIVGLPIAKLLLDANATVTVVHSHTKDLKAMTLQADVLIVATGHPATINGSMVKDGAVVIDVGTNRNPETGKLCGDVDFASVEPKASLITPVPGGVGPMTICSLMENTITCYLRRMEGKKFSITAI